MTDTPDELIREILVELLGAPLERDVTWKPMVSDPYGVKQMSDTSRTTTRITEPIPESYETIKRQYQRKREAEQAIKDLIKAELTSLLAKLPEKQRFGGYSKGRNKFDDHMLGLINGYNKGVDDSRAVIQEAITAIEKRE